MRMMIFGKLNKIDLLDKGACTIIIILIADYVSPDIINLKKKRYILIERRELIP